MKITAGLLGGIGMGAGLIGSTIGAIGSAVNNRKAQEERTRAYNQATDFLDSQYYRDPLTTVGNKALLKSLSERMKDQNEALENRAIAGGATIENQLAARKANNRTMTGVYSNLLMGEEARKQALDRQKMQLDQNYSAGVQASYLQNAKDWQAWGSQMGNAGMNLASSGLLDDPSKVLYTFGKK